MVVERPSEILIGPRTTVFALLRAYPFLEAWLLCHEPGFEALARPRGRVAWARVTTLDDVALRVDLTWRQLVRKIALEIENVTGRAPRTAGAVRPVADDDSRLGALQEISDELEKGASLLAMAARWQEVTSDLEPAETADVEGAMGLAAVSARAAMEQRLEAAVRATEVSGAPVAPEGHPLDTSRREAHQIRRLCEGLRIELERLGGSPSRRRWRRERPGVSRLVDGLAGVELRFRRELQAWFPALGVYGVDGPRALLVERQAEALEALRRLRLAVAGDDAASAVESGDRLVDLLEELLAQDEYVLIPLAERHFSESDWGAVRELEDGVGWSLIPTPPAWSAS